ncbi:MAG: OadG family protein [Oscillibacter sp.]|nr:OadG family protein [Oscillibacter sp.]
MDYPAFFVILMGLGTVFFGLICLIALTMCMGRILSRTAPPAPEPAPPVVLPKTPVTEPNLPEMVAAISAAIAEELDTDITGIRILSMRRL